MHASERDTPRVQRLRLHYMEHVAQRADVYCFYSLDETDLRLDYARRYARAPGGQHQGQAVSLKRGRALTPIVALSRGLTAVKVQK